MPKVVLGETLYDITEVAALLGVTTRTVQTYILDKRIQGQKIGRKWFFTEDNLKAFISGRQPKKQD